MMILRKKKILLSKIMQNKKNLNTQGTYWAH